jgi:hypothetical protein
MESCSHSSLVEASVAIQVGNANDFFLNHQALVVGVDLSNTHKALDLTWG